MKLGRECVYKGKIGDELGNDERFMTSKGISRNSLWILDIQFSLTIEIGIHINSSVFWYPKNIIIKYEKYSLAMKLRIILEFIKRIYSLSNNRIFD